MLTLPIKKKWFDMIRHGEKKEEYRNITLRYESMFLNAMNENGELDCILRNGYSKTSPQIKIRASLSIGYGNPNWGADPNEQYFILKILKIE